MHLPENIRRLFLAVDAPIEASEFIQLNNNLFSHYKQLKWMRLHNLHLTIYFIGNTNADDYDKIFNVSKNIISAYSNFTIYPENICLMPSHHPRMIWIKYQIHPVFTELNHALHHALKKYELQHNQFYQEPVPHITLARYNDLKDEIKLVELKDVLLQPLHIKEIKMWKTISSETSSDYSQSKESIFLLK